MPAEDAITDIQVVSPLAMARTGESVSLFIQDLASIVPIWAKRTETVEDVTDAGGTVRTAYAWRKQQMGPGGVWQDSDDLVSGFTNESNPRQEPLFAVDPSRFIPLGEVVRIYPGVRDANPSPSVNHGLEWWFSGGPLDRALLRIVRTSDGSPPAGTINTGYPGTAALLQRWRVTSPYLSSTYPDNSGWEDVPGPIWVQVRDPNGAGFRPGGYVWASFVQGTPGYSADIYERVGLGEITVVGNTAGPYFENGGSTLHGVDSFGIGETFFYSSAGERGAVINQAIATAYSSGRLDDYIDTPYQFARNGFTGFSSLGAKELYLAQGGLPAGNTSGDFANWAGSDVLGTGHPSVRIWGGAGAFAVGTSAWASRFGFSSDSAGGRGSFGIGGSGTAEHFDSIGFFAGNYTFAADPLTPAGLFAVNSPKFAAPGFVGGGGSATWGTYETWMGSGNSANTAGFQVALNGSLQREAQIYALGGIRLYDNVTAEHDVHIKGFLTVDGGISGSYSIDGGTW
jgi:hypothetical protein